MPLSVSLDVEEPNNCDFERIRWEWIRVGGVSDVVAYLLRCDAGGFDATDAVDCVGATGGRRGGRALGDIHAAGRRRDSGRLGLSLEEGRHLLKVLQEAVVQSQICAYDRARVVAVIAAGLNDPVAVDFQRLERELMRLESPCSAHYYAGEPHAFHVMFWRENAIRCWRNSFEFLRLNLPVKV